MILWTDIQTQGRRVGYARVSTKDQRLRMQRDALEAVRCDVIYEDHGVSGGTSSRDGLNAMLAGLSAGDTVIVFKLDRLGRSVLHLADLLVRFRTEGIHFCSLSEGINTTTPGGKLVYHLFSAFAEFQRDIIIENTKAGLDATRKRGTRLGRPQSISGEDMEQARELIALSDMSVSEAARRLHLPRSTLARRLKDFAEAA